MGALGVGLIDEHHLPQAPAFRLPELVFPLLVGVGQLFVGDGDLPGQFLGIQDDGGQPAVFGRGEGGGVVLVKGGQGGLAGFANGGHGLVGHFDDVGPALFLAVAVDGLDKGSRRPAAGLDAVHVLGAGQVAPQQGHVAAFAQADGAQDLIELIGVEGAELVAEFGLGADIPGDQVVADGDAEVGGAEIEKGAGDHVLQHRLQEAERPRLLPGQLVAGAGSEAVELALEFGAEPLRRDINAAHLGYHVGDPDPEKVADAPDDEAEDQDADEAHHHDRGGALADGVQHGISQAF